MSDLHAIYIRNRSRDADVCLATSVIDQRETRRYRYYVLRGVPTETNE